MGDQKSEVYEGPIGVSKCTKINSRYTTAEDLDIKIGTGVGDSKSVYIVYRVSVDVELYNFYFLVIKRGILQWKRI